jgi:hypothetical protein
MVVQSRQLGAALRLGEDQQQNATPRLHLLQQIPAALSTLQYTTTRYILYAT